MTLQRTEEFMLGQSVKDKLNAIGDKSQLTTTNKNNLVEAVNETVAQLADIAINVKTFGAKGDGVTDDTVAIQNAINHLFAQGGGKVYLPSGKYKITFSIDVKKNVQLIGAGYATNVDDVGATTILKDGSFDGVLVSNVNAGVENLTIDGKIGNTGNGINLIGGRSFIRKVTSMNQGGNGIQVGNSLGATVNVWHMQDILTLGNGGHGVYINSGDGDPQPDANAGYLIGLDSRDNNGDGLCIENAYDNTFIGIMSEYNSGIGIRLKNGAKGNLFISPYTEANTAGTTGEIELEVGADRNTIIGYRSGTNGDSINDNGAGNYIHGRASQITGTPPYIKSKMAFKDLIIEDPNSLGYYEFIQNPTTKNLEILFEGSGATPVRAIMKHNNSGKLITQVQNLDIGDVATSYPVTARLHSENNLDFPSIPAHSTTELSVTITGVVLRDLVIATPESIPSGLMWNAYVSTTNVVKLRLANVSDVAIDPASGVWAFDVWQS